MTIKKRPGTTFITEIPSESGKCVGMAPYNGNILVACENHIYELSTKDKILRKIKFESVDK